MGVVTLIGSIVVVHIIATLLAQRKCSVIQAEVTSDHESGKLPLDTLSDDPLASNWGQITDLISRRVRWPTRVRDVAFVWLACFVFGLLVLSLDVQSLPGWLLVLKVYGLSCPAALLAVWFRHRTDEVPIAGLRGRRGRPVE